MLRFGVVVSPIPVTRGQRRVTSCERQWRVVSCGLRVASCERPEASHEWRVGGQDTEVGNPWSWRFSRFAETPNPKPQTPRAAREFPVPSLQLAVMESAQVPECSSAQVEKESSEARARAKSAVRNRKSECRNSVSGQDRPGISKSVVAMDRSVSRSRDSAS